MVIRSNMFKVVVVPLVAVSTEVVMRVLDGHVNTNFRVSTVRHVVIICLKSLFHILLANFIEVLINILSLESSHAGGCSKRNLLFVESVVVRISFFI